MPSQQITDESSANKVLKNVVAGNMIRITFRADAGDRFQMEPFLNLQHKLEFDDMWLVVAYNRLAVHGNWGDVSRTCDFTVTRMSPADREVFANVIAEIAESLEIL